MKHDAHNKETGISSTEDKMEFMPWALLATAFIFFAIGLSVGRTLVVC